MGLGGWGWGAVVFHNVDVDVIQIKFICSLDLLHYLHGRVSGWVGGWEIGD